MFTIYIHNFIASIYTKRLQSLTIKARSVDLRLDLSHPVSSTSDMFIKPVYNGHKLLLGALVGFTCIAGDQFVAASQDVRLRAAFIDNLTHATVAAVATLIVVLEYSNRLPIVEQRMLVAGAFITAALIDVDHFIEAHSWQLTVSACNKTVSIIQTKTVRIDVPHRTPPISTIDRSCTVRTFHSSCWFCSSCAYIFARFASTSGWPWYSPQSHRITFGMRHAAASGFGRTDRRLRCRMQCILRWAWRCRSPWSAWWTSFSTSGQ